MDPGAHRHTRAPHRRTRRRRRAISREHAARAALAAAGIAPADVDLIVVATTTPDMVFPSTACILQAKLGAVGGPAFDVQAVCSGFVYALAIADRMVASGMARNALVVGAEIYSRILDWNDRGIVRALRRRRGRRRARALASAGHRLRASARGRPLSRHPVRSGDVRRRRDQRHAVRADGRPRRVQVRGQGAWPRSAPRRSTPTASTCGAVDWFIPAPGQHPDHGSDREEARRCRSERMIATVDRHANTSAASIPLALDEAVRDGRIAAGHRLLLIGVGGGFTWGSVYLTIGERPVAHEDRLRISGTGLAIGRDDGRLRRASRDPGDVRRSVDRARAGSVGARHRRDRKPTSTRRSTRSR